MNDKPYIIIGASHAGAQLCLSLRQLGYTGPVIVIGNESHLPYQRPPLSKQFLSGKITNDDLDIRPAALYEKHNIDFLLDTEVTNIDRDKKIISTNNKQHPQIAYEKLALCTGANVRKLPIEGSGLDNIHYLRSLDDILAIQTSIEKSKRGGDQTTTKTQHAVIIGGGYIGLETAASLRKMSINVTLLEGAHRILGRVTAPAVSDYFSQLHQAHGVRIVTDCKITKITQSSNLDGNQTKQLDIHSTSSEKNNNLREEKETKEEIITADFIIIGIGVTPNTQLAEMAGLEIDNGVVVDEFAQTSDKDIVAAGDCTSHPSQNYGLIRLESVPNAMEQAKTAAATLCEKQKPHYSLPWFWSDQYDDKLQIAGLSLGYDEIIIRGKNTFEPSQIPSETLSSFSVFYLKENNLIAADCVNRPKDFMLTKHWLQNNHTPELKKLADENHTLSRDD